MPAVLNVVTLEPSEQLGQPGWSGDQVFSLGVILPLRTVATHMPVGNPLFSHTLFGVDLGLLVLGGLFLRDEKPRALFPWRRG